MRLAGSDDARQGGDGQRADGGQVVEDIPAELLQDPRWPRSGFTDRGRDGCRVPLP
jgi:hypothetical protein